MLFTVQSNKMIRLTCTTKLMGGKLHLPHGTVTQKMRKGLKARQLSTADAVRDLEWRLGLVVARWSRSTKLLYAGPGEYWVGDRLRASKPPRFVTNHSGQLSLLPSAGRKMSTVQSAVTLCGWGVKAGMVHSTCE